MTRLMTILALVAALVTPCAADPIDEARDLAARIERDAARIAALLVEVPPPVPDPEPEPEPEPQPPAVRKPVGYFALQPGDVGRPLATSLLRLPNVAGQTIRIRWNEIQPRENFFDWVWLDQRVAVSRQLGQPYKLLVMTGGSVPNWAADARVPWDARMLQNYRVLVQMLAQRYGSDPLLVGVHVTGPTIASAEMHASSQGVNVTSLPGYSVAKMVEAWRKAIDAYADYFPGVTCCLSISGQNAAMPYVTPTIEYAKERLGSRAGFQHNALAAKTQATATHHKLIAELGAAGWTIGYEMLCPTADSQRFQSSKLSDGLDKSAPQTSWWDIYPGDLEQLER